MAKGFHILFLVTSASLRFSDSAIMEAVLLAAGLVGQGSVSIPTKVMPSLSLVLHMHIVGLSPSLQSLQRKEGAGNGKKGLLLERVRKKW